MLSILCFITLLQITHLLVCRKNYDIWANTEVYGFSLITAASSSISSFANFISRCLNFIFTHMSRKTNFMPRKALFVKI